MLKIDKLTIQNNTGRVLLKDFSFVLNDDEKIALIGEEGNGKSTLLKIIAGIDVSDYITYTGNIYCDQKIGYLPQQIDTDNLDKDVIEYIAEDIDYNHLYSLAVDIGIDTTLFDERILSTLSGGEKVKVGLLKVLYDDPDILLLDEPTNDLDIKTLIWLEDFINNSNLSMIFISHDETLLENCATGILHLEQLKRKTEAHMTYAGVGYRQYYEYRNDLIDKTNMVARKQRSELNRQYDKWRRIYQKVNHAQSNISRANPHGGKLLKKKMHAVKSLQRNLEIKKENLTRKYEVEEAIDIFFEEVDINPKKVIIDINLDELKIEDHVLSKDIHLKVFGKDKICIIGDNGAGKTTMVKIILDELRKKDEIRLGYMPQNYYEAMDYDLKPLEFLWDGQRIEDKIRIERYLGALKFTAMEMSHRIADLSQGQKCKILLIKMILDRCDVLLLDEPTRNLSPLSNPKVREIMDDYKGCIISVSHDRKLIDEVIDKVYELDRNGLKLLI